MKAELTKKKIHIHTLEVNQLERFRQFEIKLPANVKRIVGVTITVSKV